uniref:Uncharacterized protein n=1 Tax=Arion vulgaris TaxID=1028688 RepID=A0A0B7B6B6_9EUPU
MSNNPFTRVNHVLFRVGQILLTSGIILFIVSLVTTYWVVRPTIDFKQQNINPNKTVVTINYGIFLACRQSTDGSDNIGECDSLWKTLYFINADTARYVQFVMCLAAILYAGSLTLEIVQCLPIDRFRNFLAKNRAVEMFAGVATVLVLQGIVIFAGEIKNKADRVSGQEDEQPGWSFIMAIIGLFLSVVGLIMVIMFRELPLSSPDKIGGSWLRPAAINFNRNSID